MKVLAKDDFRDFVDALIGDDSLEVEGVRAKGEKFAFGPLDSAQELRLDYDVTILPPKKYFLPQYETMLKFDLHDPFNLESVVELKKKVIIGVHPYDILAIRQMDSYFLDTDISASYLRRRKRTLIIGCDVAKVHDKAFFGSMGTGTAETGYDLFLTDLGDKVGVEIGTGEGAALLERAGNVMDAGPEDVQAAKAAREAAQKSAGREIKVGPKGWHDLLEKNYESPVWKEQSEKCLGCGTCTLVCPTCFCYDVVDDVNLDLRTGSRSRTWDGCLLREFTKVAGGEVFREDIVERYRHRFQRKGRYLPDRLGFVACVGCGRCSAQCPPDIADPVELMNMLIDNASEPVEETGHEPGSIGTDAARVEASDDVKPLHEPEPATIKRVERLTDKETLFEVALDSGKALGHDPGQFVEVSVWGHGEAPISVSSAPGGDTFELVVRKVGDVTNKLHTLKEGDKVGIRGPFGRGFDTGELKGKDLLFIGAGLGIAPMRSLINHVLNNRSDYGEATILYGCKAPCEMLFCDEVRSWDERDDVKHIRTVDACPEGDDWDGEIGLITSIIPKAEFDPANTIAIVIGPPIVYRFVNKTLLDMGVPEENILVSLERRMKCGVGKCGHCQINGIYVCKEGPVFRYTEVKDLPEAFS